MSQSTLADDDLFGEAASEMRADVEDSLEQARGALPAADDVWDVDADNTLGVLNGLKTALDVGDAVDHLRDAKKWYTMGERADAFEDAEDLEAEIESVEELIETVDAAHEDVGNLTSTIPELRGSLEEAAAAAGDATDADGGDETVEAE
ncbi:hypothetical protein L593_04160 [Salinarchaeum sp. Harcht-Bsk1]|uniref:DUF5790 family protein n=1 Tax=Salinarchaeum sp. Harcht-Bsk1 TaxID=1333523 RepID=UPI00034227C3|nr:DUF5790 family protein [Salinarchaeum sp. Harcht-Bsk1]AGN00783.1 hypothetical protein L593_04160 [Salinarchaeum sp. Harcht-Bsk1]